MFAALAVAAALAAGVNSYTPQTLVTNTSDASLVNGWGLSAGPTTPWWVVRQPHEPVDALLRHRREGRRSPSPSPAARPAPSFNGTRRLVVARRQRRFAFLFATEAGQILGWTPRPTTAAAVAPTARRQGAIFKGLTILNGQLYATDFHNGKVDVFDSSFAPVSLGLRRQDDPEGLRAVRHPGARREHLRHVRAAGRRRRGRARQAGQGLRRRVHAGRRARRARREAGRQERAAERAVGSRDWRRPSFGVFAGDLLVGNFGNGRISAYEQRGRSGSIGPAARGRRDDHRPSTASGRSRSATARAAGPTTSLYFAAGPNDEAAGAFGVITANG